MNEQDYNQLLEASWRRPLTDVETAELQKYLSANPAALAEWDNEVVLTQLIERLPEAPPVSSNFTARVLQAAELEKAARERIFSGRWYRLRNLWSVTPKWAFALAVIAVGLGGYHQHQVNDRAALAKNIVEFTAAVSASDPETMADFEPIRQLSDAQPKADIELLALMK